MLSEADIAKVDQSNLYKIYHDWPEHFMQAYKISAKVDHSPDYYDSILLCGMGGSATSCDVLGEIIRTHGKISAEVLRGERLPCKTSKHSLVIANSVSGNTKETLKMAKEASDIGAEVICISSGGALKDLARERGHRHINIPNLLLPRASLPYMLMPGFRLVDQFLEHSLDKELSNIHITLAKAKKEATTSDINKSNIARKVAAFFRSGFAFCLSSPSLLPVGNRFRNSLNENAKVHCLNQSVLEASHNEIVPFTFRDAKFNPKVLLLQWSGDEAIVINRFKQMQYFFDSIQQPVLAMKVQQSGLATAIINAIYILDFATIYVAISRMIDPSPTPAIDILKELDKK